MLNRLFLIFIAFVVSLSAISQNTVGVTVNNALAMDGYTLFSPSKNNFVYLIDNCGSIVHSWVTEENLNISFYLYKNGNLLYSARNEDFTSFNGAGKGGTLRLYDWNGNILWSYNYTDVVNFQHHHDIEPLPNGNILVMAWQNYPASEVYAKGKTFAGNSLWVDKIVEIEPIGTDSINTVWEWYAWDHVVQQANSALNTYGIVAQHPEKFDLNYYNGSNLDWQHYNGMSYNETEDLIAISTHTFNEVFIIDHSTTTVEAASSVGGNFGKGGDLLYRWGNPRTYDRGNTSDQKLFGQHNVQWIADSLPYGGDLIVHNNGLGRPGGAFTSVDIISPPRDSIGNFIIDPVNAIGPQNLTKSYTYPGMYSQYSGGAQLLPNGNVLVCPTNMGVLLELTAANQLVWEYKSPVSANGIVSQGDPHAASNSAWRAIRFAKNYPAFVGQNLVPQSTVELNGNTTNCNLYPATYICDSCIVCKDNLILPNVIGDNPNSADIYTFDNWIKSAAQIESNTGNSVIYEIGDEFIELQSNFAADGLVDFIAEINNCNTVD